MLFVSSISAKAAWLKVEPPDGGFSVFFPATPTATTKESSGTLTRIWTARAGNLQCLIGMTDYNGHLDAEQELELDMKNFLKAVNASLQSQERLSFRAAPDGPLPGLKFGFAKTGLTGQSVVVVSGDRSYQAVAIVSDGPYAKDASRCLDFKITSQSRHWQGH